MRHYYNEFDPFAAAWLRALMARGFIPEGEIDERSIVDVRPDDLREFRQCHFFAGIAGWSLALKLGGWPEDREVWTGSCPCQPLSVAGQRKGHADKRHLWPAFYNLIAKRRPTTVFGEQVASADGREWLSAVRHDLEGIGYACGAVHIEASAVGARHKRGRLFFVADAGNEKPQRHFEQKRSLCGVQSRTPTVCSDRSLSSWFFDGPTPNSVSKIDGLPRPVGEMRAFGNAIVPQVAAEFITAFMECRP